MRRFILLLLAFGVLYGATIFVGLYATDTSELKQQYTEVVKKGDQIWDVILVKKRPSGWISLPEISPISISSILISEDASFWTHNGFDWQETWEAFKLNLSRGKFARGGSTISQQVVKNVYLSNKKTLTRKLMELVLALRMERQISKRKILEIYLNIAEFGEGVFGIRQASYVYFKKHPSMLTAKEGAYLAMLLPSPKKYSVSFRKKELTPYARSAVNRILRKLHAAHRLNVEELLAEIHTPLSFEENPGVINAGSEADEEPIDEEVIEDDEIKAPSIEKSEDPADDQGEEEDEEPIPYSNTRTASRAR